MFIKKEEYDTLINKNEQLKYENEELKSRIAKFEIDKNQKIQELREEYEENKKLHKKLLAIERALDSVYGSYNDILKVVNTIRKAIKNEPSTSDQTK